MDSLVRRERIHTALGWTRNGLANLALATVSKQTDQDQRDAIATAVTARQHTEGTTEAIGEIVVPTGVL